MILIDSNILMYAAGVAHPNKSPSVDLLSRIARSEVEAAIDTEVLQEILHRYRSLNRWQEGGRVYDLARRIITVVLPMTVETMDEARRLMEHHPRLSARDALHAAICHIAKLNTICSYDQDFDTIPWLKRLEPTSIS